jgi:predicted aldo/keto reductase-like oxidoreductase
LGKGLSEKLKREERMKKISFGRRDFFKKVLAGYAVLGGISPKRLFSGIRFGGYDAKGLPCRDFGKTGVRIPIMVYGGGSRFCTVKDPEKSMELLNYALNHGLYYWDTAHDYVYDNVASEERYGLVLKDRRKEVFLSTKVGDRSYDGAMKHVEESLKRLQTNHLDLLQIHNITSLEDVDKIGAKDSVLKAVHKLKQEKVTRFIGFTGHSSASAMKAMVDRFEFDTMLIALNHYSQGKEDFEKQAVPAAVAKNMGVLAMKAIRPKETVKDVKPEDLIRYALTLPGFSAAAVGIDSMDVLKKNIALLQNFKPMTDVEMSQMGSALEPFFSSKSLPWMQPGYTDGC